MESLETNNSQYIYVIRFMLNCSAKTKLLSGRGLHSNRARVTGHASRKPRGMVVADAALLMQCITVITMDV